MSGESSTLFVDVVQVLLIVVEDSQKSSRGREVASHSTVVQEKINLIIANFFSLISVSEEYQKQISNTGEDQRDSGMYSLSGKPVI